MPNIQSARESTWIFFCLLLADLAFLGGSRCFGAEPKVTVVDYQRKQIYHSPQTPGYTCWVGTWTMPDESLMVCFTQATGPVDGRTPAPKEILQKLSWPPAGHSKNYDMTGLDMRNVHLRSYDQGKTWKQVSADRFQSCMNGITGEPQTALDDGTILRGVWGYYLPFDPQLPQTGFLQRSLNGSLTWGDPEVPLDPKKYTVWPKRIRQLNDGRLILLGGLARVPANSRTRAEYGHLLEPLLIVSGDQGKTWSSPLTVIPEKHREGWRGEEFDAAELDNGDLLCVFRRGNPNGPGEVRWQGVLKKSGKAWVPGEVGPSQLPPSGHPELLATREGPILHIATTGVSWTVDVGESWHVLDIPGTTYYPRSIQAQDGTIYMFGHTGADNPYGSVDQAIVMDYFRIRVTGNLSNKCSL